MSRTVILGFVIGSQSEFNSCEPMRHFPPPLAYGQANPWIFQVRCTQNISCQMSSISVFMCGQRALQPMNYFAILNRIRTKSRAVV